ncbi:DUF3575 domain-containing protein [Bacteroides stercorirosoris]|jgi:hypothetical protein|uniref:DUF3575 domain-containing protein n=1 Tax=Bacteroides stercorirosoris TaxID=871324 RepID=UPI003521C20C
MKYLPIINVKRIALSFGLLFGVLAGVHSQQDSHDPDVSGKPMVLYFRFDKAVVDKGYMDNDHTLHHLDGIFTDSTLAARIDSINVLAFASPDGDRKYNERLAKQRSIAVKGYLVWKYPHLDQYRIHLYPKGENWKELRRLIASDKSLPNREEVLQIIDRNPDSDRCKALLRNLDGGSSYRYIQGRLLRYLRNAAVCMVWIRPDSLPALPNPVSPHAEALGKPCEPPHAEMKSIQEQQEQTLRNVRAIEKRPLFAVKTNLLFDAAMMPNVEIEVPIGKRWSVNGEYMFPWWLLDGDKYSLQILTGGLEGRYWLGSRKNRMNREVLTGHFLGLYAGGGKYDLQWKENGYQGEFFIAAGISYGYAHEIARNLRLEYNIGIGLLRTDYRHYHARDNYQTLLWQENGKYTWFGPTKVKISLVWLMNRKVKKGGAK